jgi:UDP-N-acetylmuramoyl-L-alanyl-D-glutamate--2,6-diaminopimelate ligase
MTSEGASQHRHRFIALDALVFTNLAPEHIESHGSYENYRNAKLRLAHSLQKSRKQNKAIIVNKDDKEGALFLAIDVENKYPYSLTQITDCSIHENGVDFNFNNTKIESSLKGEFNIYNILASIHCCTHFGIKITDIASALRVFGGVKGRMEYVQAGQDFSVIVDYAHTADSLRAIYTFLKQSGRKQPLLENRIICVLGGTGGGRDKWKRTVMGKTASEFCDYIILTNEDPYDEDPKRIIDEIASGIDNARYEKIIDRQQAIKTAIKRAQKNDIVIITGKGSDPCIMEKDGQKTPWSDVEVAQEEIKKLQFNNP